jgi:hypothetical protein
MTLIWYLVIFFAKDRAGAAWVANLTTEKKRILMTADWQRGGRKQIMSQREKPTSVW